MPLRNRIGFLGSGLAINGIIESYKVAAGENISAGSFVEYSDGFVKSFGSQISGVAKTSGSAGQIIDIWVPNIVTLTVTHDGTAGSTTGGYVAIDGVTIEKGTSVKLEVGTAVSVYCGGYYQDQSYITLNGTEVARGAAAAPYTYIIKGNTTISYSYDTDHGIVTITADEDSGGSVTYPDGAFIPVTKFTAGKSYALIAKIDGTYRYINTTAFNDYTMNATEVAVTQGNGYVTFGSTPALFTAAASGDGFTLANGSNYLHGTTSSGTALRVGTTSAVWTVDTSETGGFSSGTYLPKEDSSAVWLKNNDGSYDWSIKYESANASFGYDRSGRDSTYSTGFVSFILYEKYEGGSGGSGDYTLAITNDCYYTYDIYVEVNGVKYNSTTTAEIAAGDTIYISGTEESAILLNGTRVAIGSYSFAASGNVSMVITDDGGESDDPVFHITTESSSGGATDGYTVTITGYDSSFTALSFAADGKTYQENTTFEIAEGGTLTIAMNASGKSMALLENGTVIKQGNSSFTYDYTVNGNITVDCSSSHVDYGYSVNITTE